MSAGLDALERLPSSLGYFRLLLRAFGDTPERRSAILDGTGVDEALIFDAAADVTVFQQLRQIDNLTDLLGEGWPLLAQDLFGSAAHGSLGVASITAADAADAMCVIARYSHVRAPFATRRLVRTETEWIMEMRPSAPLSERHWRSLTEANFLGVRSVLNAVMGSIPEGTRYRFMGAPPRHAERVGAVLGAGVSYDNEVAAFSLPAWCLHVRSPYADAGLHARAIEELELALERLSGPADLKRRVENLLSTNPAGRLGASAAAKALGVSRRTLVRRLADAGSSYRDLLDRDQRARAERLMSSGAYTQAQISERLGYADPTSFSRARRRWLAGDRLG